jgi:putative ribosome biogenesis GTPase RsgA
MNALLADADIRVGALSENTQKGTHTTTAQLLHLNCGGTLIDSPRCAILAGVESGAISAQRLDSYRRIVASLAEG